MIGGIGSSSQMMSQLFSRLDSKSQGYIEKSDLASAFSAISGTSGNASETSVDDVFAALDSDSDGKVAESEFASTLSELQSQLDSQFDQLGIGAGVDCDGQILVSYDLLGITPGKRVRFTKDFLIETGSVHRAIERYAEDVRARRFPGPEHSF